MVGCTRQTPAAPPVSTRVKVTYLLTGTARWASVDYTGITGEHPWEAIPLTHSWSELPGQYVYVEPGTPLRFTAFSVDVRGAPTVGSLTCAIVGSDGTVIVRQDGAIAPHDSLWSKTQVLATSVTCEGLAR